MNNKVMYMNNKHVLILSIFILLSITAYHADAQIKDSLLLKNLGKILKVRPEKMDTMLQPINREKAFIFSIIIGVDKLGKVDYVKFNSTPELINFFEYSDFEKKIKQMNLIKYKNKKLWLPFLLKNMDDDVIKNGLNKEFEIQWHNMIPIDLNITLPERSLLIFDPEIYSYKSLPPKTGY